ncbi:MAG: hypothetical protein J6O53_08260 [Eubacterium sp.]|nr:hypothetical protein [Eubacterium sp.]
MNLADTVFTDIEKKQQFEKLLGRVARGEYTAPLFVVTYPVFSSGIFEIYEYNELRQNFYRDYDDKILILGMSQSKQGAREVLMDILEQYLDDEGVFHWQ